jgi:hypothetical protein
VVLELQKRARALLSKGSSSKALQLPQVGASPKTAVATFSRRTAPLARPGKGGTAAAAAEGSASEASSASEDEGGAQRGRSSAGPLPEEAAALDVADLPPTRTVVVTLRLQGALVVSYTCDGCLRNDFETHGSLSGHRRFCDGGKWRCAWCACKSTEASGEVAPTPLGAREPRYFVFV